MRENLNTLRKSTSNDRSAKCKIASIFDKRISKRFIIEFTNKLSILLNSKIQLAAAMEILHKQTNNTQAKRMIKSVKKDVEKGNSFSNALRKFPTEFDDLYIALVKVGEVSGNLYNVLSSHAAYLLHQHQQKKKLYSASIYPSLLVMVSIASIIIFFTVLLPVISEMLSEFDAELPSGTKLLVSIGKMNFKTIALAIVPAIALIIYMFYKFKDNNFISKLVLKFPIIGLIYRKVQFARFFRTSGILLQSGMSISDSFSTSIKIIQNDILRKSLNQALVKIRKGQCISGALKSTNLFEPMSYEMIDAGERTSQLSQILVFIAEHYEKEVDNYMETLLNLVEPLIIIFVGLLLGFVVVSLYIPMFDIVNIIAY